jgi:hypothetical protein
MATRTATKSEPITVTLRKAKETKHYIVYKNNEDDAPVNTIYVLTESFTGSIPRSVEVTVTPR